MKSHRTLTALGLALALAGIGCQSETTSEDDPSVAEQALEEGGAAAPDAAPDANEPEARHHKRKGHHGPDKLLRAALKELDLSAEQRATIEESLESLQEGFRKGFDRGDHAERSKALADAVRAGSVDATALSGSDDFEAKMKEGREKLVAALDQLHATLTPEQRTQLVETLQSRMKDHGDPEKKRAWKDKMGQKGPSHFMLHGLDVSEEQRAKIDAALAAKGLDQPPEGMREGFAAMKEHKAAMLAAFASDNFDAGALLPAKGPDFAAGKRRFIDSLAVSVPLLDESQRAELAERIERGPMFDRKMKKGKRGPRGERKGDHRRGGMRAPMPADQL